MTNVMSIAVSGMQSAMQNFGKAASEVVAAGFPVAPAAAPATSGMLNTPSLSAFGDLATPTVDALQAANNFRASVAVFQAGEQMAKTALDLLA